MVYDALVDPLQIRGEDCGTAAALVRHWCGNLNAKVDATCRHPPPALCQGEGAAQHQAPKCNPNVASRLQPRRHMSPFNVIWRHFTAICALHTKFFSVTSAQICLRKP